jgi:hypothetical protein
MTTFYDEQMEVVVAQALAYLMSERGQEEMRKSSRASKELEELFRKARDIPWEKLHEPFTI